MEANTQDADCAFHALTREALEGYTIERVRAGGGTRPALLLLESQGQRAIVKDYAPTSWLVRTLVGPWLIGREERLYRSLEDIPGVPRLIGRLDRHALVVEHIDGRACSEYPDGSLPLEFFERLEAVVEGLHSRGIVHCDIKNRSNIVVTEDLQPYIVDFASAFSKDGRFSRLRRFAFEKFRVDDRRAVVKALIHVGRAWNESDAHFAFHHGPAERAVRVVRNAARRVFKFLAGS